MTPEQWYRSGDTGVSSETIWHVMTGYPVKSYGYPIDVSDFGRCHRMLRAFPEWRARMNEVADRFPREWTLLVKHWDELTALYEKEHDRAPELYRRMKVLECDAGLLLGCAANEHRFCCRRETT